MNKKYKKCLKRIQHSLIFLIFSAFASQNLLALSIGDIKLESKLGNPLLATVSLSNVANLVKEEIHIRQAPIEVYENLGVDRSALYRTLLFRVDDNNVLTISSTTPIKEPFLHFVIQVRWPEGEMYQEVKLLIDPPKSSIN